MQLSSKTVKPGTLIPALQLHRSYTPLHSYIQLSYPMNKELEAYGRQLCAISYAGESKVYEGGSISNGRFHFKTRSFGLYSLAVDSVKPRVRIERLGRHFRFRVSDNLSGIKSYKTLVDGKWVLMEYEPKLNLMFGSIPDSSRIRQTQFQHHCYR